MTNNQTSDPQTEIINRITGRRQWTRRYDHHLAAAGRTFGLVRTLRPRFRSREFLRQLRHSPAVAQTVRTQLAPSLPVRLVEMAGVIARRIQDSRLARPRLRRIEAKVSPEELVLASGKPPSSSPAGETPFPQMFAERGISPAGSGGFSTGQRIPPMPPKFGGTGFSVGQRIPPMPKKDKPAAGRPAPHPTPPAKKPKPPKPLPGQRIFSRVQEILPGEAPPAVEEPGETVDAVETAAPDTAELPPTAAAAPETDQLAGGDTPIDSAGTAPVLRRADSDQIVEPVARPVPSEGEPDDGSKPGRPARDAGDVGETRPAASPVEPIETVKPQSLPPASDAALEAIQPEPEQPSTRRPAREAEPEMESGPTGRKIVPPVPPLTGAEPSEPQRPEAGPAEKSPALPVSEEPAPTEPGPEVESDAATDLVFKAEPAVDTAPATAVREMPEMETDPSAHPEPGPATAPGQVAQDEAAHRPRPVVQPAKAPEMRPRVRPLPPAPVDQVPESVVRPLAPQTPAEEPGAPFTSPQLASLDEVVEVETVSGSAEAPEAAPAPVPPPVPGAEQSAVPAEPVDLPPIARKPAVAGDQETAVAEPIDKKPAGTESLASPVPGAEQPSVSVEPTDLSPLARKLAAAGDQEAGADGPVDKAPTGAVTGDRQEPLKPKPNLPSGDVSGLDRKQPPETEAPSPAEPTALEPPALPSDLSRRLASRRPLAVSQPQPAVEGLPARLALAVGRIRQRQQPGVGPLRRRPDADRSLPADDPLVLHTSPAGTDPAAGAHQMPGGDPHQAALQAFKKRFGLSAGLQVPSRSAALAGLAALGQPKIEYAGGQVPRTQKTDTPGTDKPFTLSDISLGKPKFKVVKRQPASPGSKQTSSEAVEPSRRSGAGISIGRSPLELVRRASIGSQDSADTAAASGPESAAESAESAEDDDTIDLDNLARDVYPIIKRLLALERERIG